MRIISMKSASLPIATGLIAAAILVAPAPAQKFEDNLLTHTGKRIRGVEILSMTADTITYRRGDQEYPLPANSLVSVRWSNVPAAFDLARSAVNNGDNAAAAELFQQAADEAKREPLEQEAAFLAADALVRSCGTDALKARTAVDRLRAFLNGAPDAYRTPDALLQLGTALLAAGEPEEAATTLRKLADDSLTKNWSPVWAARAKYELARALLAQGDAGNARATFRAARASADSAAAGNPSPELEALKASASVGEGEAFVHESKYDDALRFFRDLAQRAESSGDSATYAAARAGEGEALYLKAVQAGDKKGLRTAQIALADASLFDVSAADTTAKSMYYSGLVLLELGSEREAPTYKTRAAEYFSSVTKAYPRSEWAIKAGAALNR